MWQDHMMSYANSIICTHESSGLWYAAAATIAAFIMIQLRID